MSKVGDQFKEFKEKNLLNLNPKQAKYVTWGAYLVIAIVLFSMLSNNLFGTGEAPKPNNAGFINEPQATGKTETDISAVEQEIENRLEKILGMIQGAGQVSVNVSLASGITYEYATNVSSNIKSTEEQVSGGSRSINESVEEGKIVLTRGNSNLENPVVIRENRPEVLGVLVVAEGASDPKVRLELSRAVETVLGLASHQVHVVPRER